MSQSHLITRRKAMHAAAAGLVGYGLLPAAGLAADRPLYTGPIIDTHTHFYDPRRPEGIPWPGKDDKSLYRPVLPPDFLKLAGPLGVTGTVVVEASPRLEDNQWLLDLAEKDTTVVGVVGNLSPGDDDFAGHLQRFAKNRLFRGIRIGHGLVKERLSNQRFLADLKRLADAGCELDVNGGPDMPADVARLAKAIPELRIAINHVANVRIDGREPPPEWLAGMNAAAEHLQVFCKVSALVEGAAPPDKQAPVEVDFYRPVLDAAWKIFGEDRLFYGSNWPVSDRAASYEVLFRIVREYFAEKGAEASAKFFHRNAQAAYRWPNRSPNSNQPRGR